MQDRGVERGHLARPGEELLTLTGARVNVTISDAPSSATAVAFSGSTAMARSRSSMAGSRLLRPPTAWRHRAASTSGSGASG